MQEYATAVGRVIDDYTANCNRILESASDTFNAARVADPTGFQLNNAWQTVHEELSFQRVVARSRVHEIVSQTRTALIQVGFLLAQERSVGIQAAEATAEIDRRHQTNVSRSIDLWQMYQQLLGI